MSYKKGKHKAQRPHFKCLLDEMKMPEKAVKSHAVNGLCNGLAMEGLESKKLSVCLFRYSTTIQNPAFQRHKQHNTTKIEYAQLPLSTLNNSSLEISGLF